MNSSRSLIPFTIWIKKFRKEKSNKGIFSRWIDGNGSFIHIDAKDVFIERLLKSGCTEFIIETFESLWNDFLIVSNARITIPTIDCKGKKYRSRLD